jgi:hypothetical protein
LPYCNREREGEIAGKFSEPFLNNFFSADHGILRTLYKIYL